MSAAATEPWVLQEPKKPRKWQLTDFQRKILLERYDGRKATIDELMRYFPGVPRWRVKHWAGELGLARRKEPNWTADDVAYLEQQLGHRRVEAIAKHLGRTVTAVKLKSKRLGINQTSEGYTMRGLCLGLGVDHHKVEKWLAAGWLRGARRHTERTVMQGGDTWYFSDQAIYELVRNHPNEIDPRRVEWIWLVDILTDPHRKVAAKGGQP